MMDDGRSQMVRIPPYKLQKHSTIFLTEKVMKPNSVNLSRKSSCEHKDATFSRDRSQISFKSDDVKTNLPMLSNQMIQLSNLSPREAAEDISEHRQLFHLLQVPLGQFRRPTQPMDDPLSKKVKRTFINASKDENLFYLYQMLRKSSAKPDDIKKISKSQDPGKKSQFKSFANSTKTRGQTFVRFAFKSHERDDNQYINQYMEEITKNIGIQKLGTMSVSDLWANKQVLRFLKSSHLKNDKTMLQKINKIMVKDRQAADQKQLVKDKQAYNVIRDKTKFSDHAEHLGKQIFSHKKHYQQQLLSKLLSPRNSDQEKFSHLVDQIDLIHEDNLTLYNQMSRTLSKIKFSPPKRNSPNDSQTSFAQFNDKILK